MWKVWAEFAKAMKKACMLLRSLMAPTFLARNCAKVPYKYLSIHQQCRPKLDAPDIDAGSCVIALEIV